MADMNNQEILTRFQSLTVQEQAQLISGISLDAARIIKKLLPDNPLADQLISIKQNLPF